MQPWFRFYDDAATDPKVQRLPAHLFKTWVNLLCLANKNNGTLPSLDHIAYMLHETEASVSEAFQALVQAGLFERANATTWAPHNWRGRQYKSDSSTERVKRFRKRSQERSSNGQGNVPETPPEREKERETEREITPTGLSLSPEKERARETRAPLKAPRARAPNRPTPQPQPAAPPQAVADMNYRNGAVDFNRYTVQCTNCGHQAQVRVPPPWEKIVTCSKCEHTDWQLLATEVPKYCKPLEYPEHLTDEERRLIAIEPNTWTPARILTARNQRSGQ